MSRMTWSQRAQGLKREVYALYLACRDPRVPLLTKVIAAGVVAYALSPIDLIPDFIPILGYLDDLVLLPLGVLLVRALIPADVMEDCRRRAAEAFATGKPTSRAGLVIVVGIWIGLAALALWWGTRLIRTGDRDERRIRQPLLRLRGRRDPSFRILPPGDLPGRPRCTRSPSDVCPGSCVD